MLLAAVARLWARVAFAVVAGVVVVVVAAQQPWFRRNQMWESAAPFSWPPPTTTGRASLRLLQLQLQLRLRRRRRRATGHCLRGADQSESVRIPLECNGISICFARVQRAESSREIVLSYFAASLASVVRACVCALAERLTGFSAATAAAAAPRSACSAAREGCCSCSPNPPRTFLRSPFARRVVGARAPTETQDTHTINDSRRHCFRSHNSRAQLALAHALGRAPERAESAPTAAATATAATHSPPSTQTSHIKSIKVRPAAGQHRALQGRQLTQAHSRSS